jgi:glycosyltransferase involved in cell wall biosynthesis
MLPQDHNAMGEALVCLLQDRSRLSVLARDGRELAAEEFDFEVCADRFLKIYEGTGA